MLNDRKALVEYELANKKQQAASLYLKMVTNDYAALRYQEHYECLKAEISSLEFDLNMINQILLEG